MAATLNENGTPDEIPCLDEIRCPACRKPPPVPRAAPYYPFCTRRCRDRDLAAWSDERYRFPGPVVTDDDADEDTSD